MKKDNSISMRSTEFFDAEAGQWEDRYASDPRFHRRFERVSELLDRVLPRTPGRALDVGCGTGVFSRELARRGWRVTAIDASPDMIDEAQGHAGNDSIEFVNRSYESYQTMPASFDVILALSMLEYVEDDESALRKFAELLKPDGILILSVPNRKGMLRILEGTIFGIRTVTRGRVFGSRGEYLVHQKHQYSPLELRLMLRQFGFRKVYGTFLSAGISRPGWLLPFFERRWWAAMYCAVFKVGTS